MARITKQEYLTILIRQGKSKEFIQSEDKRLGNEPKKTKHGNVKVVLDGILFDSKKEARRYQELKILERVGKITNLQLQPKFVLLEWSKWARGITYIADFSYTENWQSIVEDVKSKHTAKNYVYKNKIKISKQKYPELVFREFI